MAIFMTLLGKYSTRSHQWEGELWQGDKMEAVIYLGALGWWMRHQPCTEEGSQGRASTLHPGLHVLRLQRRVVNAGLSEALAAHQPPPLPKLHEALLHLQHPWEHQQQQRQGDRHQENQRRRLSSGGGSQGKSQSAQGDMPPTPGILARGAASKESREEKNKSSLP